MFSNDTINPYGIGSPGELYGQPARTMPARRMLTRRLSTRVATLCCIVLALCLLSPSLWRSLPGDAGLQQLLVPGDSSVRGLLRSAASFTQLIDQALWPSRPLLTHLHSLAWLALLVWIVGATYRRFGAASHGLSLALLLFAIDDAHAPLVTSLANRNSVVALCLALPALLVHDRQRRSGFLQGIWIGPLLMCTALLSGQAALSVCAYLIAYAWCFDRGSWVARFGSLLPYAVVVLGWKLSTLYLDHGVLPSAPHLGPDPAHTLLALGLDVCQRLPVLALSLIAAPFADFWQSFSLSAPWLRVSVLCEALIVLGLFGLALRPLMRRHARIHFWSTGSALSLLFVCVGFPEDRLLIGPSLGALAIIAEMIEVGWARRKHLVPVLGMGALAAVHLVAAPVLAPLRAGRVGELAWPAAEHGRAP